MSQDTVNILIANIKYSNTIYSNLKLSQFYRNSNQYSGLWKVFDIDSCDELLNLIWGIKKTPQLKKQYN